MGPRKDQIEKLAWQWAETTSPSDITTQHIRSAYILSPPHNRKTACKKNCRHQPLCLTGLGEQRWLQLASCSISTAISAGSSVANSCEQQLQLPELRSAGVPAGLTNLGATCYVNSLLQLWYHNHAFRSAILQWSPYDDPTERDNPSLLTDCYQPLTPVGQLQLIFGLMLAAKLRTVETAPLVSSLRLDASYQQDAQEFSKLLSSLLEKSLQHQTSPRLRCLVQTLMRGQYEYVTRCSQCLVESVSAAPFYELDLQIQGNRQLLDCIAGFLSGEKLVGNNQYYCQFCSEKRDATRSIRLCSLPPVLNFQLMRFVFDRESGLKKKLSSQLQFPELLDMAQFGSFPADRCTVYRLQAVLLHKGRSAYSGHYTAQICNSETGFWFRFNDEEVEKIKSLKLPVDEDFTAGKKSVGRPPRCPKGFHSSGDAYMLVYMAKSELLANQGSDDVTAGQSQLSTHLTDQSQLPEHLLSTIERINGDVQSRLNSIERQKDAAADVYQSREREVRELYPQLISVDPLSPAAAAGDGGSFRLLPTSWLCAWLQGDAPGPIATSGLLCPHDKLALQHASRVKCVQPGAAEMLSALYGGSTLDESALCRLCVFSRCRVIRTKSLLEQHVKLISQILRQTSDTDTSGETGRQYWVGKRTLRNWRQMALSSVPADPVMTAAAAENGCSRSPEQLGDVGESCRSMEASQRVDDVEEAATAAARLSPAPSASPGVDIGDSKTDIRGSGKSRQCAGESLKPSRSVCEKTSLNNGVRPPDESDHGGRKSGGAVCENGDVKEVEDVVSEAVASGAAGDGVAATKVEPGADGVGSSAFSNCAAVNGERNSPIDSGGSEDKRATEEESSEEEEEVFNGDIICPHGCLCADESLRRLVPESVWDIFLQHFPGSFKFGQDTPACSECKRAMCEDEQMRQLYREMANEQRSSLSDLYLNRSRPQVAAPSAGATTGATYNCVSEASTHRWRRYIRDPHKRCPTFLESGDLLCSHGRLLYNPNSAQDNNCLVLLHEWEWEVVRRSGHDGVQVTVTSSRSPCDDPVTQQQPSQSSRLITSPVACEECIEKRRAEEHQQQLQYERGRIFIRKVTSIETELHATAAKRARLELDPAGADVSVRRSRRCRSSCVEKSVSVHSADTLLTLKVQIMKLFKVATYDQHLVYDGIQLLDNQSTLSQLGVPTGSTILLQADEASEDVDLTISEDMCASVCPELGFSGTGLAES